MDKQGNFLAVQRNYFWLRSGSSARGPYSAPVTKEAIRDKQDRGGPETAGDARPRGNARTGQFGNRGGGGKRRSARRLPGILRAGLSGLGLAHSAGPRHGLVGQAAQYSARECDRPQGWAP